MNRKSWPNQISANMLATLTGKDRRTVTSRLEGVTPVKETSRVRYYDMKTALQMIFEPPHEDKESDEGPINGLLEKAKLDRARRRTLELDFEVRKKNLIERSELKTAIEKVFGAVRAKLLNVPQKAVQQIPADPTPKEIQKVLKKQIADSLTDLAEKKLDEFI